MAEEDEQAVVLGEGEPVEGVPLARVAARLMWGIETSAIKSREGETVIRTPDGPRPLSEILDAIDIPYFATQREFETAVRDVIGTGPVPTVGDEPDVSEESSGDDESEKDGEKADEENTGDGADGEETVDEETGAENDGVDDENVADGDDESEASGDNEEAADEE